MNASMDAKLAVSSVNADCWETKGISKTIWIEMQCLYYARYRILLCGLTSVYKRDC